MAGYVTDAPDTLKLKVFCIEAYRMKHGLTAPRTFELSDRHGVFDYLNEPAMQWQCIENTILDVEEFIENHPRRRLSPASADGRIPRRMNACSSRFCLRVRNDRREATGPASLGNRYDCMKHAQ